jgi:hypothetical protein
MRWTFALAFALACGWSALAPAGDTGGAGFNPAAFKSNMSGGGGFDSPVAKGGGGFDAQVAAAAAVSAEVTSRP